MELTLPKGAEYASLAFAKNHGKLRRRELQQGLPWPWRGPGTYHVQVRERILDLQLRVAGPRRGARVGAAHGRRRHASRWRRAVRPMVCISIVCKYRAQQASQTSAQTLHAIYALSTIGCILS
jgi:hypothetical protein